MKPVLAIPFTPRVEIYPTKDSLEIVQTASDGLTATCISVRRRDVVDLTLALHHALHQPLDGSEG